MRVAVLLLATSAACGFGSPPGGNGATDALPPDSVVDIDAAGDAVAVDAMVDGNPADDDDDDDGVLDVADNCPVTPNAAQYNEDADSRGDACDLCPHIDESSDVDGDGDGIGDACDPRPGTADRRVYFTGFNEPAEIDAWTRSGAWSVTAGRLLVSNNGSATADIQPPVGALDRAYVAVRVTSNFDSNGDRVRIESGQAAGPPVQDYACEYAQQGMSYLVRASVRIGGDIQVDEDSTNESTTYDMSSLQSDKFRCRIDNIVSELNLPNERAGTIALSATNTNPGFHYLFVVELPD